MSEPPSSQSEALTPALFAAHFRESSRVLWCIAAGVLQDRGQAEDVLQEAAMTALSKLDSFRPGSSFVAWMSQFVRYVALNQRRKVDRRARALQAEGANPLSNAPAEPRTGADTFDANVMRALGSLGETARTCLLLKTVLELDYAEIADLLQIPPGTAMSHVSRARAKMQQLLAEPELAVELGGVR
jgi:RNA polymerase sigma-70 factor, ECF subfamily